MKQQQLRSSTLNKAPQPGDLIDGELALNTNSGSPAVYLKDDSGTVRKIAGEGAVGSTTINGESGAITLDKTSVGLDDVDNTSDADKPISTDAQAALDAKADLVGGKVPSSQIPSIAITEYLGAVASQSAMLGLSGESGDWCNRTDTSTTFVLIKTGGGAIGDWEEISYPSSGVVSVNTQTGVVVLGAADVGAATAAEGALAASALQPGEAATTGQGSKADSAVQPGDDVSDLNNDAGYLTAATYPAAPVASVNTKTGAVVLDAGDVGAATTAQGNKADSALQPGDAATTAQGLKADSAVQPGDDISDLNNDAGFITASTAPVTSVNTQIGVVSLSLNNLTDVTVGSVSTGDVLQWSGSAWVSTDSIDGGAY